LKKLVDEGKKKVVDSSQTSTEEELRRNSERLEALVEERTRNLRESEARYCAIIEDQSELICRFLPGGTLTFVNEAYCRYFGMKREELIRKSFSPLILEEDREKVMKAHASLTQEHPVVNVEERVVTPTGETRWQQWTNRAIFDEQGRLVEFQAVGRDITAQKNMEEELRRERDLTNLIVKTSPVGIVVVDRSGRITFANSRAEQILGLTKDEMTRGTYNAPDWYFTDHDGHPLPDKDLPFLRAMAVGQLVYGMHQSIKWPNGRRTLLSINAAPICDESGRVNEMVAAVEDITERTKIEEMKDRFMSSVTHELRTPLVSIVGYLDYILTGKIGSVPERIESSLRVIKRNTEILLKLANDLVEIRRIESGKLNVELRPLDLKEVIAHCAEEVQLFIERKKQNFHFEVPDGPLPIQGDWERLSQVLVNLLNNATKFTPEGGDITLHVEDEEAAVKVQVSDTGLGLRKEDLEIVFEPFADIKKPTYFKGTGLGLSVTKALVEAHGGRIWADSEGEGKGSIFTFRLPKRVDG
jgi:PAS domain S-box-containing protein